MTRLYLETLSIDTEYDPMMDSQNNSVAASVRLFAKLPQNFFGLQATP